MNTLIVGNLSLIKRLHSVSRDLIFIQIKLIYIPFLSEKKKSSIPTIYVLFLKKRKEKTSILLNLQK
jgi:hypothetical protein